MQSKNTIVSLGFDMAVMSLMDHSIISFGTFGFWGAFLKQSNGTTLFYEFESSVKNSVKSLNSYGATWIGMRDPCDELINGKHTFKNTSECIK